MELVSNVLLKFCVLLMHGVLGGLLVSRETGQLTSRVLDGLLMVSDVQLISSSDELLMMSVVLLISGVCCRCLVDVAWVPVEMVGLLSYVERRVLKHEH